LPPASFWRSGGLEASQPSRQEGEAVTCLPSCWLASQLSGKPLFFRLPLGRLSPQSLKALSA